MAQANRVQTFMISSALSSNKDVAAVIYVQWNDDAL